MKLHALLHHGVPRTDVHALAMNNDSFAVRCYCCNVPVEPYPDTPLLEIVEYCIAKAVETRVSINLPVKSWFRMRGVSGEDNYLNALLQCMARTPFLLTILKKRVTSENRVDIPGGPLKFFDGQAIELPTIENFPLRRCSWFEKWYDVMNELISGADSVVSAAGLEGLSYFKRLFDFTFVNHCDRSELEQLIARTFYGTRPSEEQISKRCSILDFYDAQLRRSSTAYSHAKIFRGTYVTKRYCSHNTESQISHFHYELFNTTVGPRTLQSYLKLLVLGSFKYESSECMRKHGLKCTRYKVTLILEPPPVLYLRVDWPDPKKFSFPFVLDITQYCAPNVLQEQEKILYALYGLIFTTPLGKYAAYVKVRPPIGTDEERWKFISQHSKDDLQILADRAADLMGNPLCTENNEEKAEKQAEHSAPEQEDPDVPPPPGKWYYVLDSDVREVPDEQVLEAQPEFMFYERIA